MYSTSIMAGAMAFVFHLTAMNEITKSFQISFSCLLAVFGSFVCCKSACLAVKLQSSLYCAV